MTASVIIPHLKNQATLPQTLESIREAARGCDVEIVCVEDAERHGVAWGRNQGLERANGDVIFFSDADDTVAKEFFCEPLAELERTGADICFFEFSGNKLARDYNLNSNAEVRSVLLQAFLGYSFDAVRRWNSGGSLWQGRELGYIWRTAIRRDFIERHKIRFDEAMHVSDDAAFLCECAVYAERTCSIRKQLYEYAIRPGSFSLVAARSRVRWDEKFATKAMRERIDALANGEAWKYCEASCVFALLEMMASWHKAGLSPTEAWRGIKEYLSDVRVREAVHKFPLSWRHPATAAAVMFLRTIAR